MSVPKISLKETIKKQYQYKFKANIDAFSSLIFVQLLAILFSLGGIGSSSGGSTGFSYHANYYSADLIIGFTMLWAFMTAITITTKGYRNHDFTFITNRLSSSLSNVLFLATVALLGSLLALLSGNLLKFITYILLEDPLYSFEGGILNFVVSLITAFLYIFMFSALGYFMGALVQINKLFAWLLPVLFIGLAVTSWIILGLPILNLVLEFYGFESIFILFTMKVLLTTAILFTVATSIWNRLEVRP